MCVLKSCLAINVAINATDIVLDWLLALRWGWGVVGVGYATAIAQYTGVVVSAATIARLLSHPRFSASASNRGGRSIIILNTQF